MQSCLEDSLINTVRVICWQGDQQESDDLLRVSLRGAKSIIILGPGGSAQRSDQEVLRTILAIQGLQGRTKGRIVAEVCVMQNREIIQAIGDGEDKDGTKGGGVLGIVARDMVNRVLVYSGSLPAIGACWADLMTFVGNEFYCFPMEQWQGKTWGHLRSAASNFIAVGVVQDHGHGIYWSPDDGYLLGGGEEVIVICDDDELTWEGLSIQAASEALSIQAASEAQGDTGGGSWLAAGLEGDDYVALRDKETNGKQLFCIIGWATDTPQIMKLINNVVGYGSELHILSPVGMYKRAVSIMEANLAPDGYSPLFNQETPYDEALKGMPTMPSLGNLTVKHYIGSSVYLHQLFQLPLPRADNILILADDECEEPIESDSIVITTLLHLCYEAEKRSDFSLRRKPGCEVCDWRSERIVRKSTVLKKKGNFLRSSELETGMFALCAHHPLIGSVMRDLLETESASGSRIAQVSATQFVGVNEVRTFSQMANRVKLSGDTLVGYAQPEEDDEDDGLNHDVVLNPPHKSRPITWGEDDLLLVIVGGPQNSLLLH